MYELKLSEQQLNVIGAALVEMPYKTVAPVIAVINAQIAAQSLPAEPPKEADAPKQ